MATHREPEAEPADHPPVVGDADDSADPDGERADPGADGERGEGATDDSPDGSTEAHARRRLRLEDVDADSPARFINRELSWLDFNERVLALAEDDRTPVLERAKYLAICGTNLDEFFQVRVAGLKDQLAAGVPASGRDRMSPAEQLREIRERADDQLRRMSSTFLDRVAPGLDAAGIRLSDWESLDDDDREFLVDVFARRIFPVLTPLAVDPGHPFPHISDLSLNLAVIVGDPERDDRRFARVKVPPVLPRFVVMPDGERFVPLEQVIAAHLDHLFPGMVIECHFPFRVTRNADLILDEEEADDLLAAVEIELRRRRRGRAVRLEIDAKMSEDVRDVLMRELELAPSDVYVVDGPLDLGGLWAVHELDRPELKDDPWAPTTQPRLAGTDQGPVDIFGAMRDGDILVHHPYDSFATSVETFIKRAAADPDVQAIKLTLYRTSGDSPIVKALIRAAERDKQVAVLVEVKARFDEQANIGWAKALEDAGVHVVYGIVGLKTHSKTALVVRQEDDGVRRYCHIGTGNYNPKTARLYEDLGILSADPDLGADLTNLFNFLTGYSRLVDYRRLVLAPYGLRDRVLELIRAEAGRGPQGRIVLKMNGLDDPVVIDALYEASQAGVPIDLVVRSICCLRPGVPGLSETIRVRSIVGRYLEHSRIFYFGAGADRPEGQERALGPAGEGAGGAEGGPGGEWYIGSADLRSRNLDRRIEVVLPVREPLLQRRLQEVLEVNLADDGLAWTLQPDGAWLPPPAPEGGRSSKATHLRLQQAAVVRARPWLEPEDMP
ncbi:MAG TPA: polyphosphate kinase 1 [Acidimicrobiales bacterium]|nr:polyphosphate kinase 1 [Acidimicrobiales bacterium]